MLLLLATGCTHTQLAEREAGETSIPMIASVGEIQIGYSTQEDLERCCGPGKTIVGGHPNSGRVWRVAGTQWMLTTDGFEYSQRGLVVDSLSLSEAHQADNEVPFARLKVGDLAWLGEISLGMSEAKVQAALERRGLQAKRTQAGFDIVAKGHHALVSYGAFRTWTVSCGFTNGCLNTLEIDARE